MPPDEAIRAIRAVVRGRVQAVGFREFVRRHAVTLGLAGWVRNGDDGMTVEVAAEGDAEALDALVARLRGGPPASRVDSMEIESAEPDGSADFTIRF
ncbi:MAG: acylphosphatase [Dehalococcoidia bacterium]|nr:acylphosphatase [Dehalococcoidia bacterium]